MEVGGGANFYDFMILRIYYFTTLHGRDMKARQVRNDQAQLRLPLSFLVVRIHT